MLKIKIKYKTLNKFHICHKHLGLDPQTITPHTPSFLLLSVVWGALVESFEKHPVTPCWFSITLSCQYSFCTEELLVRN